VNFLASNHWLEVVFRCVTAMAALFAITRILGKTHLAQLSFMQFVVAITLGDLAGFISTDVRNNYGQGLIALAVWAIIPLGLDYLALHSRTIRDWFDGKARVMIKEGKVLEDNLKKERMTADELLERLRVKNVFQLSHVEFASMEPSGEISVLLKKEYQPVTANTLQRKVAPEHEAQTVIIDGKIIDEGLATSGMSREWLMTELDKLGLTVENVFIGQINPYGQFTADVYDDQLMLPQPTNKSLLWATLRKCEADLELFALASRNPTASAVYSECASKLKAELHELEPYLKQ
jgi:uncharacterized membrane protein YcaP (DUF421 family)